MLSALLGIGAFACGDGSDDSGEDGGGSGNDSGGGNDVIPSEPPGGICHMEDVAGICNEYWGDDMGAMEMSCFGEWSETERCGSDGVCGTCVVDYGIIAKTYYYDGSGDEDMSKDVCGNGQGKWRDVSSVTCR
jgi:hypothetical protein